MRRRRDQRLRVVRTDVNRDYRLSAASSWLLLLLSLTLIGCGTYAWTMDRPQPTEVRSGIAVSPGPSPWFDPGVTLFAPEADARPEDLAAQWDCRVTGDGDSASVTKAPSLYQVGTRVVAEDAMTPVLEVGPLKADEQVICDRVANGTSYLVLLPTDPGYPKVPASLIVGGIALTGIAVVVHPRSRGVIRFG